MLDPAWMEHQWKVHPCLQPWDSCLQELCKSCTAGHQVQSIVDFSLDCVAAWERKAASGPAVLRDFLWRTSKKASSYLFHLPSEETSVWTLEKRNPVISAATAQRTTFSLICFEKLFVKFFAVAGMVDDLHHHSLSQHVYSVLWL